MSCIRCLLYLCFVCLSSTVKAQVNFKTEDLGQPITYQRVLPKAVLNSVPRGAQSLFWGVFGLPAKGSKYGVHLIDPNWRRNFDISQHRNRGPKNLLFADVWILSHGRWKRSRHLSLRYIGFITQRMHFDVSLLWLDKAHTQPIIRFKSLNLQDDASPENAANEVALIFPQGLEGTYILQKWTVGFWRASDTLGQHVTYGPYDGRGQLQIKTEEPLNDDIFTYRWRTYGWNGRRFVVVKEFVRKSA